MEKLKLALQKLKESNRKNELDLNQSIQNEYNRLFADMLWLKLAIEKTEASKNLGFDECGSLYSYHYVYELENFEEEDREYLDTYLADYCIYIDWKNVVFQQNQGECIQINTNEKTVFTETGKVLTSYKDWNEESQEVLQAIDDYQNKQGCFNNVVTTDCHGNVYYCKEYNDYITEKNRK